MRPDSKTLKKALKTAFVIAGLTLGLAACGSDPLQPTLDALKASDFAKAEALTDALLKTKPELKALHATRFVLFQYLMLHGDPARQQDYVTKSIAEYDFLVQALGLKADYQNMESSVRANPEGATLLSVARKPIYGE